MIYMDNASTTSLSKNALDAMMPFLTAEYGNPSSGYSFGRIARNAVDAARECVATAIGAKPQEIFFTASGTEADNWAIKSAAELEAKKGKHIISTETEHHAVIHTLQQLDKKGYEITYLGVNERGCITLEQLRDAIRTDTILITIMTANNEIGTIMPISEIGNIARERGILFHTDAVQAAGHIPIDVSEMNVDMLSMSGHKFKGPKGTGVLYVRKGLKLPPNLYGGTQERGRRAGTENVAGIVGLAAALNEAVINMEKNTNKIKAMNSRLIEGILEIQDAQLTGDPESRLPGLASFVFRGVEGESTVLLLDQAGICASAGSACSSGSLEPSHVLRAIGLPHEILRGALRLSLSEDNTEDDVSYVLEKLPQIIAKLRSRTAY